MPSINESVGARVRAVRTDCGMSIGEVVAELRNPITIQQFANYEKGVSRWPVDLLVDVARILEFDIQTFCEEAEKNGY